MTADIVSYDVSTLEMTPLVSGVKTFTVRTSQGNFDFKIESDGSLRLNNDGQLVIKPAAEGHHPPVKESE